MSDDTYTCEITLEAGGIQSLSGDPSRVAEIVGQCIVIYRTDEMMRIVGYDLARNTITVERARLSWWRRAWTWLKLATKGGAGMSAATVRFYARCFCAGAVVGNLLAWIVFGFTANAWGAFAFFLACAGLFVWGVARMDHDGSEAA
jgi:Flp pilus assembly protein TadB